MDNEKQLSLALQEIEQVEVQVEVRGRRHWNSFQLQIALRQAEDHAQQQTYEAPTELIELLKRTHYHEEAAFEVKRKLAETALLSAKDQVNVEPELLSIHFMFVLDGPNF